MTGQTGALVIIRDEEIWQHLCSYLRRKLLIKKCVKFSNLGTFGFTHRELLLTDRVYINVHRPVFLLSEKLCQSYGIVQRKHVIEGSIPLLQLNYSELSAQVLIPREQIEGCIENVCVTLGQYLYLEKFAEIIFNDIGKLRIHKGKSKFCFFSSFLNELDNTGRLAQSFQNVS
uniref:Hypotheticial protein n=1 Tax=Schistosoma japonicum TaxID=6182 RepID=C1LDZ1_SCHJA|nr:hypotheticial protein [Schistosoma japonicum]